MMKLQSFLLLLTFVLKFKYFLAEEHQLPFCPKGWTFSKEFGHCYVIPKYVRLSWSDATDFCRFQNLSGAADAELVSVDSQEEYEFVTNLMKNAVEIEPGDNITSSDIDESFWIGLRYSGANAFVWSDGRKVYFKRLESGLNLASVGNKTCFGWRMLKRKGWTKLECNSEHLFVCKKRANLNSYCGNGFYGGLFGEIRSPKYTDIHCYYQIIVPEGNIIEVNTSYRLKRDGCNSYIKIFDGAGVFRMIGDRWCGMSHFDQMQFASTYGTENALTFISKFVNGNNDYFLASYRAIPDKKTMHFTGHNGTLMSLNYPNAYPPSTNQLYKIHGPPAHRIRIIVDDFHTQPGKDTLLIVEGRFVDLNRGRQMAWLSGVNGSYFQAWQSMPIIIETLESNDVSIQFKTDHSNKEAKGFKLRWLAIPQKSQIE